MGDSQRVVDTDVMHTIKPFTVILCFCNNTPWCCGVTLHLALLTFALSAHFGNTIAVSSVLCVCHFFLFCDSHSQQQYYSQLVYVSVQYGLMNYELYIVCLLCTCAKV